MLSGVRNAATGEYIGFRWDYGDVGPMTPPLSAEVIQSLTGLFLSPQPDDYYCAHGNGWDWPLPSWGWRQLVRRMAKALAT